MLKGIPPIISPELMHVLMKMGHGDELVLGDGNFPADSNAQRIVRADGHNCVSLLEAILDFFPLDTFIERPAFVMEPVDPATPEPSIWSEFRRVIATQVSITKPNSLHISCHVGFVRLKNKISTSILPKV